MKPTRTVNTENILLAVAIIAAIALGVRALTQKPSTIQTQGVSHFTNLYAENITANNDLAVGNNTTITGDLTIAGKATFSSNLTAGGTMSLSATAPLTVTAGMAIEPSGTYQPLTAASAVTCTIKATGYSAGNLLVLTNVGSNAITVTDTATTMLSGNIALGQYDTLALLFDGTNWLQLATSNN